MELSELRTRVGVADLVATYQFLADAGKVKQLAELFAQQGVLETDNGRFVGRDEILGFFVGVKDSFISADFAPARHYLSSIYVDPAPDGHALVYACFQFVGSRGLDHWGTYRDEVVPVADGWQFSHRKVTVEGAVAESPVRRLLGLQL